MAFTKESIDLLALTAFSSGTITPNTAVDVSGKYAGIVFVEMGRASGTAFTAPPVVYIEGTGKSSPNHDDYGEIFSTPMFLGATIGSSTWSSGGTGGTNSITVGSGTNYSNGEKIFIKNSTLSLSEFCRVGSKATNTLTLSDNLTNTQGSGATVYGQAEWYASEIIRLDSLAKLRVTVDLATAGQGLHVRVRLFDVSSYT